MNVTLEQWLIFKTIVDEGTFAKAAEALNKSQSSISYAANQLSQQIATPVLELRGRKAELTEAGKTLYRHAEALLKQADTMEQIAEDMASGIEASITLAADALVPLEPLLCALHHFSERFPRTRVKVLETSLSGTDEALLSGRAKIALMARVPPGFLAQPLTQISMLPVASSQHTLGLQQLKEETISEVSLRQTRQIVLRDTGIKREQDAGWLGAEQRWTFSHFSTCLQAIKTGLGFGFLPDHMVEQELKRGELVQLKLENGGKRELPLAIVKANTDYTGPAVEGVTKAISEAFKKHR